MIIISNGAPHKFQKKNLVTQQDRKGFFDLFVCSKCGIQGKSRKLTVIEIPSSVSKEKVYNCNGVVEEKPKKIKVIRCTALGKAFANLTPDSEHNVVKPPDPYKDDHKGVWVMGVDEPVKLLNHEFTTTE